MKDKKIENDRFQLSLPINRKSFKYAVAFLIAAAIVYTVVTAPQKIGNVISAVITLLSPFLIGFCLAYVVNLLLRPLEKFWMWCWRKLKNQNFICKIKRLVCLSFSFIIVLGAIFAIVFMIIPAIKDTVVNFANELPKYAKTIEGWYYNVADFLLQHGFDLPEKISLNTGRLTDIAKNVISNYGNSVLDTTFNVTASIFGVLVDIVLGIVFAIYLLAQKENFGKQTKKAIKAIFDTKRANKILELTTLTNNIFTKFVTGQLTEACIIGILCFIGMLVFGMPYAGMISVLIGFTALIPLFGAFIGTAIGAFLILLEDPLKAFWFIVFVIILQQLEGNLIYPRVVGKSVGLPGIWVLTAVTIGGGLFGIAGMLFSVPICSVLYVLFRRFVNRKTKEDATLVKNEKPKEI